MAASQAILVAMIGLALTSVIESKAPRKIVNGSDAKITNFAYVASIQRFGTHWCGAVLITRRHILTAAHCMADFGTGHVKLFDKSEFSIVTGTSNYNYPKYISGIKRIDIHPGFTGDLPDFLDDIAIITLAHEITIDETQKVVGLPSSDVNVGIYGTSLGWGYTSHDSDVTSDVLKMTPMMTLSNHECNQRIPTKIYDGQFCGFYKRGTGICHGDSGGPMIYNNEVIGVISMGWKCGSGYPDVYTRVYFYLPWIYGIIGSY